MPITEEKYNEYITELQHAIDSIPYLKERDDAFMAEVQKKMKKNAGNGTKASEEKAVSRFHDPDNQKTELYDHLIPMMRTNVFKNMVKAISDGKVAENFMNSLTDHMKLVWELETPSHENHGMQKIMNPEDYNRLKESLDNLLNQTSHILEEFSTLDNNMVKGNNGFPGAFEILTQFGRLLYKDANAVEKLAKTAPAVPLNTALKDVQAVQVTGAADNSNTVGGVQSSRKVITVVDREGNQKTGLFTPKNNVTENPDSNSDLFAQQWLLSKKGARLDNRNSAMSKVAALLGRGKLLAYSSEMKIDSEITKSNPTGTGTFMEAVNGTDFERILPTDAFFSIDMKDPKADVFTDNAKKDMMDLSIIDYLCGNMDRHSHNMIYHYAVDTDGKIKLNRITGIDNDSSFTKADIPVSQARSRLASLVETICISEEMAAKLEAMTSESLSKDMAEFGLDNEEMAAMNKRLRNLKDALEEGKKFREEQLTTDMQWNSFLKDGLGFMKNEVGSTTSRKPCLVVIPNDKLKALRVDGLANVNPYSAADGTLIDSGVFNMVSYLHSRHKQKDLQQVALHNAMTNVRKIKSNSVLRVGVANFSEITNAVQKNIKNFQMECKDKTSKIRGTSQEFENIVETLGVIERATAQMGQKDYIPGNNDSNLISDLYKRLQENCKDYLLRKKNEIAAGKSASGYAQKRIDLVKRIAQHADVTRKRVRDSWNDELSSLNIQMAKDANTINSLTKQMKPLEDFLAANKENTGKGTELPTEQTEQLKKNLPDLVKKLFDFSSQQFSKQSDSIANAEHVCATLLENVIKRLGGDEACGIDEATRTMLNDCKKMSTYFVKKDEPAEPKTNQKDVQIDTLVKK